MKRVLARHRGIDGYPGERKVQAKLWSIADSLLPTEHIDVYTQGLMDLGAMVCTRAAPRCGDCPVATDCVAVATDRVAVLPSPRPAKPRPTRAVRVLLLEHAGTILLEKRPALGIWAAVLLIACRLVQGFGVGGEWGGAVLMAVEHAPDDRKGALGQGRRGRAIPWWRKRKAQSRLTTGYTFACSM